MALNLRGAGDDPEQPGVKPLIPADAPMSVKLADVVDRHATALNPDDLSVVNAAVVDLQAYEALIAVGDAGTLEPPVNVDVPFVQQDGDVLTCTMGNWEGEPDSYSYQWQFNGVSGGTDDSSYTVSPTDAGMTATCVVTATNASGSTTAPPSNGVVIAA